MLPSTNTVTKQKLGRSKGDNPGINFHPKQLMLVILHCRASWLTLTVLIASHGSWVDNNVIDTQMKMLDVERV